MNTFNLNLVSIAKKSGGDKYSGDLGDEKLTDIYVPQNISRELSNKPISILKFSLSEIEIDNSYTITLTKQAKSKGGDKYEGEIKGDPFIVYLPQKITRKCKDPCIKMYVLFNENNDKENNIKKIQEENEVIIKRLQEENEKLREEIKKLEEELKNLMV